MTSDVERGAQPVTPSASPAQRAFFGLVGVFFLTGIGWRGGRLLIALGALSQQASQFQIGILAATSVIFPLLLSVYAGRTSDRLGPRRPIVWGSVAIATGLFLPFLNFNLSILFVCALILGLGQIFVQVSVQNGVGAVSTPLSRSRNYATLQVGGSIATFVGPLIVGSTVDHFGLEQSFVVLAVIAFAITAPAILLTGNLDGRGQKQRQRDGARTLDLLASEEMRRIILMSGVAVCGIELFAFYIPIYGKSIGLSATMIGAVIAVHAAAIFAVRLGLSSLLRLGSETAIARAALFLAAFSFAIIPISSSVLLLFAAAFLLGLGLGVSAPLTQVLTYNAAPEGRSGEALGLRITVNKMMQIAVPVAFGSVGAVFGVAAVFVGNAGIILLGGLASMFRGRSTPAE